MAILCVAILALCFSPVLAKSEEKAAEKRQEIDQMARETLDGLFKENAEAKILYDKGLMLQADVAGTKHWKDKKLNQ